jgi:hypothetical protein
VYPYGYGRPKNDTSSRSRSTVTDVPGDELIGPSANAALALIVNPNAKLQIVPNLRMLIVVPQLSDISSAETDSIPPRLEKCRVTVL